MKLYIVGPPNGGEGVYSILAETGEYLASHFCSSRGYAKGDIEARRPDRQAAWREKLGDYEVLYLGDDDMTRDELLMRNRVWYEATTPADPQPEGGVR